MPAGKQAALEAALGRLLGDSMHKDHPKASEMAQAALAMPDEKPMIKLMLEVPDGVGLTIIVNGVDLLMGTDDE